MLVTSISYKQLFSGKAFVERFNRRIKDNKEFAKLAAIVTDVNINAKDMESAIYTAIPTPTRYNERQRFLAAAKVMVATVFAHGNVKITKDKHFEQVVNWNLSTDYVFLNDTKETKSISIVLSKCFTSKPAEMRLQLQAEYELRKTTGINSVEAMSRALEAVVTGNEDEMITNEAKEVVERKLGCIFEDDQFTYRMVKNQNPKEGIYAKDDREPIRFESWETLKEFTTSLVDKVCNPLVARIRYNQIDQLIRLVKLHIVS